MLSCSTLLETSEASRKKNLTSNKTNNYCICLCITTLDTETKVHGLLYLSTPV